MAVIVRPVAPTDYVALELLDSELPHGPPRDHAIRAWIASGQAHLAVDGDEPAGFAVMTRQFFDRGFVELLMVARKYQRRGVGRAILRHLAEHSPTPLLWTSTNESNAPMRGLLAAESYVFSGAVEGLDEGDPELFFRKRVRAE